MDEKRCATRLVLCTLMAETSSKAEEAFVMDITGVSSIFGLPTKEPWEDFYKITIIDHSWFNLVTTVGYIRKSNTTLELIRYELEEMNFCSYCKETPNKFTNFYYLCEAGCLDETSDYQLYTDIVVEEA